MTRITWICGLGLAGLFCGCVGGVKTLVFNPPLPNAPHLPLKVSVGSIEDRSSQDPECGRKVGSTLTLSGSRKFKPFSHIKWHGQDLAEGIENFIVDDLRTSGLFSSVTIENTDIVRSQELALRNLHRLKQWGQWTPQMEEAETAFKAEIAKLKASNPKNEADIRIEGRLLRACCVMGSFRGVPVWLHLQLAATDIKTNTYILKKDFFKEWSVSTARASVPGGNESAYGEALRAILKELRSGLQAALDRSSPQKASSPPSIEAPPESVEEILKRIQQSP